MTANPPNRDPYDHDEHDGHSVDGAAILDALHAIVTRYVVLPSPADGEVAAGLDATDGLVQASAESRTTRAWSLAPAVDPNAMDGPGSVPRGVLLAVQAVAALVVVVLCLPTWRATRSRRDDS